MITNSATANTNTITRPRRESDDIFFLEGDQLALQTSDAIIISYIQQQEQQRDEQQQQRDEQQNNNSSSYKEEYYDPSYYSQNNLHNESFQCRTCQKTFTSEHLLDVHIHESHDVFFQLAQERNSNSTNSTNMKHLHKCLVENCSCTFSSEYERCQHLICIHDYPKWFRFHSRRRNKNTINTNHKNNHKRRFHKGMNYGSSTIPILETTYRDKHIDDDNDDNDEIMSMTSTQSPLEIIQQQQKEIEKKKKLKQRKDRKKKVNATIPCRYYHNKHGCWRGDKCMFLHEKICNDNVLKEQNGSSHVGSMDICQDVIDNTLVDGMKSKVQIGSNSSSGNTRSIVPTKISFGRSRKRR